MHPPFFVVDHRFGQDPLPLEERRVIRRNRPERLGLGLPSPGLPVVTFAAAHPPAPLRPRRPWQVVLRLWAQLRGRMPGAVAR